MTQNTKKVSVWRVLVLVLLVFLLIAGIGAYIGLLSITMIAWWIPLLFSSVIAAATGTVLWTKWEKLTEINSFAVNFILHIIFFSFFLTGVLYFLNFIGSVNRPPHKAEATVVEKYKEKHYTSRRIGRNRYVRGNPYYEYYMEVELPSDKRRKIQLPYKTYQKIKTDRDITLSFSKGWLGVDVIQTSDILADNPDLNKIPEHRPRRCKFFGTSGR